MVEASDSTVETKMGASSQTVSRALSVLELIGKHGQLGVREIARHVELAPSMVQRLLNSLAVAGFVEKTEGTLKWKIGYKAFQVGSAFLTNTDLNAATAPELRYLAEEKLINSFLGVLRESDAVYVAAVQSRGPISITNAPGSRAHLHSTSLGKVLLAGLSDSEAAKLLGKPPYQQLTAKTKRSFTAIAKDLERCRDLGYTICDEENLQNVFAVGAPIFNAEGRTIAALSGAVQRQGLRQRSIDELCNEVKEAARRASRRLGAP